MPVIVLRGMVISMLVVLITFLAPVNISRGQGAPSPEIIFISPPVGVALPLDQAIQVQYGVSGGAAALELTVDDTQLAMGWAQPGQVVARTWAPATFGPHCLALRALDARGNVVRKVERRIMGLVRGSRVRLNVGIGEPCTR
ncbi:MAG: hypothetical protein HY741_10700 [Chloroflexi bacterium]|nr:hypothetical protein [Chloroflexota bacterium]